MTEYLIDASVLVQSVITDSNTSNVDAMSGLSLDNGLKPHCYQELPITRWLQPLALIKGAKVLNV